MISGIFAFNRTISKLSLTYMPSGVSGLADLGVGLTQNHSAFSANFGTIWYKFNTSSPNFLGCPLTNLIIDSLCNAICKLSHGFLAMYLDNCKFDYYIL